MTTEEVADRRNDDEIYETTVAEAIIAWAGEPAQGQAGAGGLRCEVGFV